MLQRSRRVVALAALFVIFGGAVILMYRDASAVVEDAVPYVLDDGYIHMAMAKNLSQEGIWGVHRYEFTSSSSSPLWTVALAGAYTLTGVNDITPLVLNIVFAVALMLLLYFSLRGWSFSPAYAAAGTLGILFLCSILPLIFAGMEHIMHCLLTVIFVLVAARCLTLGEKHEIVTLCALGMVTVLFVATRYESLFMVAIFLLIALTRRRWASAVAAAAGAILPVLTYGLISVIHGSYLLPNTILLKGARPSGVLDIFRVLTVDAAFSLGRAPHMAVLLGVVLLIGYVNYRTGSKVWSAGITMVALVVGSTILQLQLGAISSWKSGFCRYDAYLMTAGLLALLVSFREIQRSREKVIMRPQTLLQWIAAGLGLLFLFTPLIGRGYRSLEHVSPGARNIYEQQVQMGRFLHRFYERATVAANDIGAINYFADIHCLDLFGLANRNVAARKMQGTYDTAESLDEITRENGAEIAIIYDHWFPNRPQRWTCIGEWTIHDNVVCGGETVTFYACRPSAVDKLVSSLQKFQPLLPAGVNVELFTPKE